MASTTRQPSGLRPRIRLELHRPILPFDSDTPPPRRMTAGERIGHDLHVVTARLARADRGRDRLDLVDVDDGLLSVAADSLNGSSASRKMPEPTEDAGTASSGVLRPALIASAEQLRHLSAESLGGRLEVAQHLCGDPVVFPSDPEQ